MEAGSAGTVCICIAAFNAERTIARAINSALQDAHVTEVIVVNDASTDATSDVARGCDDGTGRLTVIELKRNSGPSVARNTALAHSRADIFGILDSDDYLLPGRISRLMSVDSGGWDFIADDILIVPEHLATVAISGTAADVQKPPVVLDVSTFVRSNISNPRSPRAELGFLKPLIRRSFLDFKSLRYDPDMRLGEDYALYVRALLAGATFKIVGFCGYVAIERATSLSAVHRPVDLAGIRDFDESCLKHSDVDSMTRQALAAHSRATTNKWVMAEALNIRRARGLAAALRFVAGNPKSASYVLSEFVRAKTAAAWNMRPNPTGGPAIRRLIGGTSIGATRLL